jgi:predicted Zn-ribbon and HTH transcriptional regulator
MKPCPECKSENIYKFKKLIDAEGGHGPDLLPKLSSGIFKPAKLLPVLCGDCGYVRYFAAKEALKELIHSEHWKNV